MFSTLRLKRPMRVNLSLSIAIFFITVLSVALSSDFLFSAFTDNSADTDQSRIAEVVDRRHAALVVTHDDLLNRIVIPVARIDQAIDRRVMLQSVFDRVTAGEKSDLGRVKAWVRYVQDRVAHPKWAPLLDNGQAIYDPYWILKNRLGHCGQTNRVVVDGLEAAGFKARIVQLKAHVAAEVWLDGQWRYLDADWLNLGQFVVRKDGSLVSALEIHRDPSLLARIMHQKHAQSF